MMKRIIQADEIDEALSPLGNSRSHLKTSSEDIHNNGDNHGAASPLWQLYFFPDQLERPTKIFAVEVFSGLTAVGT
jgi:hypothetical protein